MRPEIKALYTSEIRQQAISAFRLNQAKLLSDWHAETYGGLRDGLTSVLRISHEAHRSRAQVEAELDWTRELIECGIEAPMPLLSAGGRYAVPIPDENGPFTVAGYSGLRGRHIDNGEDWGPRLFERWGELVGRLHHLSISRRPQHARPAWHESDFLAVERYVPAEEVEIRTRALALIAGLRRRNTQSQYFGLIHADVYQDNMRLLEDGSLELHDFDNCEYGWLVSDVAIALYAALWRVTEPGDRQDFAFRFVEAFMRGYERRHHLPGSELRSLNDWLLLREVLIYVVLHKQMDPSRLNPTLAGLTAERRTRIAQGVPIVSVG